MNARRTPARIVAAQHPDQISNLLRHLGATRLATVYSPYPEQAKTLAMPSDDCLGFDDHQDRSPITPYAPQPHPAVATPRRFGRSVLASAVWELNGARQSVVA